ncbi:MAG: DNA photolyase family protein [Gammaproteobacteria bacterium]|nr:DNA photolyase family protein [Gammaproteobacteria bacterium]
MPKEQPAIVWFRQDLRLEDNPALCAAAETERPLLPVYVLDDDSPGEWNMGAASRWWLHASLGKLRESLGGELQVLRGNAAAVIPELANIHDAQGVYWNRCYEPWRTARDRNIKATLRGDGRVAESFGGTMMFEPQSVTKGDGTPYRVFTPFYRKGCLEGMPAPRSPLARPTFSCVTNEQPADAIDELGLLPKMRWDEGLRQAWSPGEEGARQRLGEFIENGLSHYKDGRNFPSKPYVSRLSPHLHFGEVSPQQAWYAAESADAPANDVDHFRSELGWREFSHHLLYHFPQLPRSNLQAKFDRFPWRDDAVALRRWQKGITGYPIVDAGMRELWQTGYMHNRIRMIVGSFLVKNLLLHWHHGEDWFWDTLVDADLANNSASWQWIAGCGADAAPYFRIFNPVTQSQKFDPDGEYIRRYVPEIACLPTKHLHAPWEAPAAILDKTGVRLGVDYPEPIIDLKMSRERALQAFHGLKGSAA